jgi:hypothetical protein
MEVGKYERKYVGEIIGLRNPGTAVCYFNSLIQALMSCPAFNKHLLFGKASVISTEYLKLAGFDGLGPRPSAKQILLGDASTLLKLVIDARTKGGFVINLAANQQEDLHEGLYIFLEVIGCSVDLFKLKHKVSITCNRCRRSHTVGDSSTPYECGFTPGDGITTRAEMEQYIMGSSTELSDYRCERCNAIGPGVIVKESRIMRLSEIIVLVFNKLRPGIKYFPNKMEFYSAPLKSMLKYRVVAQVEHLGHMNNGHYRVLALRKSPGDLGEVAAGALSSGVAGRVAELTRQESVLIARKQAAREGYNTAEPSIKPARKNHYMEIASKLKEVQKEISELKSSLVSKPNAVSTPAVSSEAIFVFDDSRITHITEFVPTINTYVVFYNRF